MLDLVVLAAVVRTVLGPTDTALGQAVVSNPHVPVRLRQALNVEAGLNDGRSVPFLALFPIVAAAEEEHLSADLWIRFALEQVGLGLLVSVGVRLAGSYPDGRVRHIRTSIVNRPFAAE